MSDAHISPADDTLELTIDDLCKRFGVEPRWIIDLVEHGVLDPAGSTTTEWRFAEISMVRVAKASRLSSDLDINPPGIAMVFDLLEEIDQLRAELRNFRAD